MQGTDIHARIKAADDKGDCSSVISDGPADNDMARRLAGDIRRALMNEGASVVGFADLRTVPSKARRSMDYAVSIGVALNPCVIGNLARKGPGMELSYEKVRTGQFLNFSYEKVRTGQFLNYLGEFTAKLLRDRGYEAVPLIPDVPDDPGYLDRQTLCAPFQHKTAATLAGLGWIGKSALLVTEEYGPALRLNTVLTDAAFECGVPVCASRCGECRECADACPAKAITGNLWDISKSREDVVKGRSHLLDMIGCARHIVAVNEQLGIGPWEAKVCGYCLAACPRTRQYVKRHNFNA